MPELALFIGKGGTGKTTAAASYAVWQAVRAPRRSVLLLSTDPAHSVADIFQSRLGTTVRRFALPWPGRLFLWQVDARRQFDRFLKKQRAPLLDLLESGTFFTRAEIEPLLDATLPGMAEVSALLALDELLAARAYDHIVVDTAPMGHTLRLFDMPQHFARFLDFLQAAGARDRVLAQRFAGHSLEEQPFIARWRALVDSVQRSLRAESAHVYLVTTAEKFSLNESARARDWLDQSASGVVIRSVLLNRVVKGAAGCLHCRSRAKAAAAARPVLRREFPRVPVLTGEDSGSPILGARDLRAFAEHAFAGKRLRLSAKPPAAPELRLRRAAWPRLRTPLNFVLGKGGVGKTTFSAGLAVAERGRKGGAVTLCSTDPSPSLDDVFGRRVGSHPTAVLDDSRLRALEVDSVAEYQRWAEQMKSRMDAGLGSSRGGLHVDLSLEREVLAALLDVVPPGVDEVFAILCILDLREGSSSRRRSPALLVDMAPTGHALELLRTPERLLTWSRLLLKTLAAHRTLAFARDAGVEIAALSQKVRQLARILGDDRQSRLWPVMLPEPLPDRETARLLRSLKELGAKLGGLVVNRVIFAQDAAGCARCARARMWQAATLARLGSRRQEQDVYLVRNYSREISGRRALQSFTREIWQIE